MSVRERLWAVSCFTFLCFSNGPIWIYSTRLTGEQVERHNKTVIVMTCCLLSSNFSRSNQLPMRDFLTLGKLSFTCALIYVGRQNTSARQLRACCSFFSWRHIRLCVVPFPIRHVFVMCWSVMGDSKVLRNRKTILITVDSKAANPWVLSPICGLCKNTWWTARVGVGAAGSLWHLDLAVVRSSVCALHLSYGSPCWPMYSQGKM
jgi:hypothetical protein